LSFLLLLLLLLLLFKHAIREYMITITIYFVVLIRALLSKNNFLHYLTISSLGTWSVQFVPKDSIFSSVLSWWHEGLLMKLP
jgi:hypothetical protein